MTRETCLELKSLKEYLLTYLNLGIFQRNIAFKCAEKSCGEAATALPTPSGW
jgi:7-cyano-7-deazaguanine reductase